MELITLVKRATVAPRLRRSELGEIVGAMLAQISPKSREVLALRYLAGYSEAELAVACGVSPATIKSRLHYPLYLVEQGGLGPETMGALISLSSLDRLLALWLGGSLSERWGRMPVLIPSLLVYGALMGSLTLIKHPIWLALWSLMIGAASGVVAGLPTALIGDRVHPPCRGSRSAGCVP